MKTFQLSQKSLRCIYPPEGKVKSALPEGVLDENRIMRLVFYHEDAQLLFDMLGPVISGASL